MNSNKLWQTTANQLHPLVEKFTVSDDYLLDLELLPYDLQASLAHAKMLHKIGILTEHELESAEAGLNEILEQWQKQDFRIESRQEDGHTAIEQYLTRHHGAIGQKIHTGRSRNDQSLVMMRLFMKDKLSQIETKIQTLVQIFQAASQKYQHIPMPGYTHLQKAMPTTVGLWLDSFAAALADFQVILNSVLKIIDQNPLGSASGFGIENLELDRDFTTRQLGFAKTQTNPLYCGMARGYFENIVLQTLSQPIFVAGRFAHDMLLFTTQEFNFFALPNEYTTGSSIMPQKRNYDLFEIMRGNSKVFQAYQNQVQNIVSTIGSGYQRDLQLTKKPLVAGVQLCSRTIDLLTELIPVLQVHENQLNKAMTSDLYVTNEVYELVKQGKSFRTAYFEIKAKLGID